MRRLPKQLRILSHRIPVIVVSDLIHQGEDDEHAHRAYGVFDPARLVISIDDDSGRERMKVTLVHEALHAMLNVGKVDEVHTEEELVGRMAPVLLDFLRSNVGAILYLQEN